MAKASDLLRSQAKSGSVARLARGGQTAGGRPAWNSNPAYPNSSLPAEASRRIGSWDGGITAVSLSIDSGMGVSPSFRRYLEPRILS